MQQPHEGQVELLAWARRLWRRRKTIAVTAVVVWAAVIGYVLLATPIYQAKIFVMPPAENDIVNLNYGRGPGQGTDVITVKDVNAVYLRNLFSESLQQHFFYDVYVPSLGQAAEGISQDERYARYLKVVQVAASGSDASMRYSISVKLPSAQEAVHWVSRYADLAGERTKQELIKEVRSDAVVKADNLQRLISSSQETARKRRDDQIVQLTEALVVARSIGLERPPIISGALSDEVSSSMGGALTYMRGSKALEAEIENLEKRSSDDPFIHELRAQQADLAFYRALEVSPAAISVYRLDGDVVVPDKPIGPKRLVLAGAGAIIGLLIGCMLAALLDILRVGAYRDSTN